jgi:ADP-ribose pyrophosphatase
MSTPPYCLLTRHHPRNENMGEDWPKIKARHTRRVSPWMAIIEREVEFAPGAECDLPCGQPAGLHRHRRSVTGSPPSYRPAIPPGVGELYLGIACRANRSRRGCGVACCRRELMEETGFAARAVHALGCYAPCTARLSNRVHSFYVEIDSSAERKPTEPGIELKLVSLANCASSPSRIKNYHR